MVVAEDGGRDVEKMWFILSRSLWRTFTLGHLRSFLFHEMSCAPSAMGMCYGRSICMFVGIYLMARSSYFVDWFDYRKGSKSGASMTCAGCQGSGMKISMRHLGANMIQQMQHPCNECKGTGETISDKDRCPQCKGEKVVQQKKVLEVHVEKGMQNGQKITFPGEADEAVCFGS